MWKLLLWTHIMRSKDLSMQVKQTIVRLQKQNKSIREIAGTFGLAKSTVWYILRKKESTGELSNIKRPGRPQRTTVVDDRRILSMVKKNPFTTSNQEKNTLQEVDVTLSKSTIKRRLHKSKYRGFTTRCKQGLIRLCQKKHLKKPDHFWKSILWTVEIKIDLYQNDRKKKVWRRLGAAHDPKHKSSVKHSGAEWWHEHAWLPVALGYWCLVMKWQKTEAAGRILKCIRIYCLPRFSQMQQSWFIVQMDNEETQSMVMSMSSRLKAIIACKGFSTKYWKLTFYLWLYLYYYLPNYIWAPENGGNVYKNGCNSYDFDVIFLFNPFKLKLQCTSI